MAVIDAQLTSGAFGDRFNTYISADLNKYEVDYWPPHDAISGVGEISDVTSNLPVSTTPRELDTQRVRSFFDDYYNRVHIRPRALNFGNLVTTQVSEVYVWNAWLFPITVTGIVGVETGVSIAGPQEPPFEMGALQELTWDVTVTEDGPSDIDVTIVWDFAEVPNVSLAVTGARIVAWTIVPDWKEGIRERLAWATDVIQSDQRNEQRRALRLSPRRTFQTRVIVEGRERSLFDVQMRGWGGRVWALPVWPDIQFLQSPVSAGATSISCTTEGRDFRDRGLALLRGENAFDFEIVQIDEVTSNSLELLRPTQRAWPIDTRLYPVRAARFAEQPQVRRLSDRAAGAELMFALVEPSDWEAADLPTYRGFPVLDAVPDESKDLSSTYDRALHVLENPSGFPFVLDAAEQAFLVKEHSWVLSGITERSDFRSLLYALRGRQVAVWVPTHADDLRLVETLGGAAVAATIENVGYARFGLGRLGCQDIRIELNSGDVFYRRITNATAIDDDTEQITIDESIGQAIAPDDVHRISFMALMRCQSDEIEIVHHTDVEGAATSSMTFVGVNDE